MSQPVTHPFPIPSHLTRHNSVGKPRRQDGDPVAALKEMIRFEPIPHPAPQRLAVPFSVFDPDASIAAEDANKLVFHFVGDVGGVNGTATQESIHVSSTSSVTWFTSTGSRSCTRLSSTSPISTTRL
jgi:hypothetical protein